MMDLLTILGQVVKNFNKVEHFEIKYFKQENHGKMQAINNLMQYVTGELVMDCDSDDYFITGAFKNISEHSMELLKNDNLYASVFLRSGEYANVKGKSFENTKDETTMFDMYFKQGMDGEKVLVYKSSIRKLYKYELKNGEKFITEASLFYKIEEKYKVKCYNLEVVSGDYLEEGYTKNFIKLFINNPQGYLQYFQDILARDTKGVKFDKRLYVIKHYILFSSLCNKKVCVKCVRNLWDRLLVLMLILPGRWKSKRFVGKNYQKEEKMEDNKYAIEVNDVYKTFNVYYDRTNTLKERIIMRKKEGKEVREILKGINLKIKKGEVVGLIGVNGSGKSTLLKLMTKIIYPNKGTIKTNGKLTSLLELGAGFHPDFSGRENIYFNASIFGLTKKDIDSRINQIIEFSELQNFIDNPVRTYSSGMYMRLAFSVAINVDADILLIDEILSVGDQHFQEKCFKKIEELKAQGKTIVFVTHGMDSVKRFCTRAVWLHQGKIKMDGDTNTVVEEYIRETA